MVFGKLRKAFLDRAGALFRLPLDHHPREAWVPLEQGGEERRARDERLRDLAQSGSTLPVLTGHASSLPPY